MTLKETINKDFMEAFKAKNMEKKNFLGVIKGEIQNEEGRSGKSDDVTVLNILKKIEKSLKQTNTEDSMRELTYIEPYMPKLMTREEVETLIKGLAKEGHDNVSKIMKQFNTTYLGKADNGMVSEIAKELFYTQNG